MYEYAWYQWLLFFYVYCFFGWIFESSYVSLKERRPVNRGFLRLPMLPLYGTGAVMMLWVSLPVKDSLLMVYLSGVVAATILEYVTGWGMEKLFKVKYWDYSNQRFNLNGYICLSSSIAWGFLTIFLTEVIHRPIEQYVLGLPASVSIVCVSAVSVLFVIDTAESVKAALDLAKILDAMTAMRAELDDIQVQMALLKAETKQRLEEAKEDSALRLELMKAEAAARAAAVKEEASSMAEAASAKALAARERTAAKASAVMEGTAARASAVMDETAARASAVMEGTTVRASSVMEETASRAAQLRREKLAALSLRLKELQERQRSQLEHASLYHKGLLRRNPSASCRQFAGALKELRELLKDKKRPGQPL